jgi:hypothetical protein
MRMMIPRVTIVLLEEAFACVLKINAPQRAAFNETAKAEVVRFWAKGDLVSDWYRRKAPISGMDSDLDAFNRNPVDGSSAAIPARHVM